VLGKGHGVAKGGEPLGVIAREALRVEAIEVVAAQLAGERPSFIAFSCTILQPTSTPSLHPASVSRAFSCAAGAPWGMRR
jgi:hypothetical protein